MSDELDNIEDVEVEEDSLNEDLAAAWDASGAGDDHEVDEVPVEAVAETGEAPAEPQGEPSSEPEGVTAMVDGDADKPPQSLSPEARERWKDTPPEVQAEFARMDQRIEGMAQKYGQSYQRMQNMDKSLAPYSQYLQMNGGPGQTIQSLLQTGSLLQMGTPQQKAAMTAQLIKQFGVDIGQLDSMLVGEMPSQENQQQTQMEQMLNQKLQPLQQQLQTYQQREQFEQQQSQQQIQQELQQFQQTHEFYNDLRQDMADLMDLAANRNRQMSYEEAYNIAASNHPTISKIISSRGSQEAVNKKRSAAVSIAGSPGGDTQAASGNSITSALNDAWDAVGRA